MSSETVFLLIPELVLVVAAVAIYLAGSSVRSRDVWSGAALLAIAGSAFALWQTGQPVEGTLVGPISPDALTLFGRGLALCLGVAFVLITAKGGAGDQAPEFFGTLLIVVVGMMLVAGARDLVLLFLGLEMITIPSYILLYLARREPQPGWLAEESAAKYFFLSIFASALLLYGFSFLYGATGSTKLVDIHAALQLAAVNKGPALTFAQLGMLFIFAGLGFKIGAVPFHFYAPDVYQGTSNAAAAVLSVAPRVAGMIALIRVIGFALPELEFYSWRVALILAALTMTVGNLLALWQDNLRRLLAYSSIAHTGYMLMGLASGLAHGIERDLGQQSAAADPYAASLLYLTMYCVSTLGIFAVLVYLGKTNAQVDRVDELGGLVYSRPVAGIALTVCLLALAGLPPLAGFWGKMFLFYAALDVSGTGELAMHVRWWSVCLAVLMVINATVVAALYLRMIAVMCFRQPVETLPAEGGRGPLLAGLTCAVLVTALGMFPREVIEYTQDASASARVALQPKVVATVAAQPTVVQPVAAAK